MMKLHVLGTGCAKCRQLAQNVQAAADALGLDVEIEKVTDPNDIMGFGVMITPALAVEGQVKAAGTVPSVDQIKAMLA